MTITHKLRWWKPVQLALEMTIIKIMAGKKNYQISVLTMIKIKQTLM